MASDGRTGYLKVHNFDDILRDFITYERYLVCRSSYFIETSIPYTYPRPV